MFRLNDWCIHIPHHKRSMLYLFHLPILSLFLHEVIKVDWLALLSIWIGSKCSSFATSLNWFDYLPVEEHLSII